MSENFSVIMIQTIDDDMMSQNGGFCHPTTNGKLYITKDDVSIVLNEEEIKELVSKVGANFNC